MATKPKLMLARKFPDDVEARIEQSYDVVWNKEDVVLSADDIVSRAEGCDAIMVSPTDKIDADVIGRLPDSVKMIATFSVGFDHVDVKAATEKGLVVSNTPDVLTDATADIAMLCMLGAARLAYASECLLRERRWKRWTPTELLGVQVTGKRLGIYGMGRIGRAVAQRARGFNMDILYHDMVELPKDLVGDATYYANVEDMLPHCDFLTLHCPLTPETHHFLNKKRIETMPQNAVIINTARGPVIDDNALIAALKSGRLGGAGLDVFEGEPNINPGYFDLPNAFILPHIGSATVETRNAMGFLCVDNLDAFFAGTKMPTQVKL